VNARWAGARQRANDVVISWEEGIIDSILLTGTVLKTVCHARTIEGRVHLQPIELCLDGNSNRSGGPDCLVAAQ